MEKDSPFIAGLRQKIIPLVTRIYPEHDSAMNRLKATIRGFSASGKLKDIPEDKEKEFLEKLQQLEEEYLKY